jgi:hypothetical protein
VQWDDIEDGMEHNFKKHPRTFAYPKYEYDFSSVMQYRLNSFGIGGRPSMVLTVRYILKNDLTLSLYRYFLQFQNATLDTKTIGRVRKMSKTDISRIRSAYRCDAQGEGARQPTATNGRLEITGELSLVAQLTMY